MAAAQVVGLPTEPVSVGVNAFGTEGYLPEEAKLDWFFTQGQSLFEASTFGALLERQAAYGQAFEECWACAGSGFDEHDNSCPKCKGMGGKAVPSAGSPGADKELQQGLLFATTRCLACIIEPRNRWACMACDGFGFLAASGACCVACKCSGSKLLKSGKVRKRPARRARPVPCWSCRGKLYHERSPVGLKAETKPEPSYTPDDASLRRFAQVSRWLRQCQPDTVDTLAEFFGLSGYLWANTKWGRLFAVVPLTDAGERMLSRLPNPQDIAPHYLLENHVKDLEKLQQKDQRQQAQERLELVTRQAAERVKLAFADWTVVVRGVPS